MKRVNQSINQSKGGAIFLSTTRSTHAIQHQINVVLPCQCDCLSLSTRNHKARACARNARYRVRVGDDVRSRRLTDEFLNALIRE